MAKNKKDKVRLSEFPKVYWVSIVFEFFERGSYYGMMSFLSVYMTDELGFAKEGLFGVGGIKSILQMVFIYGLPLITGAIGDKLGYRKTLLFAFSLLGVGYFLTSQMTDHLMFFLSLVIMGVGAGTFKPLISGTIAKVTDERTSTLGFGIFYWTINLGALLFPLVLVPVLKNSFDASYVMLASAIFTSAMIIPTLFIYKEPPREETKKEPIGKTIAGIFKKVWMVILDWRFILFIFIYSWFWILYFQMFDSVLWYVQYFVNADSLNHFINNTVGLTSLFGLTWQFDVEHVTVINAGTIICLQLIISNIVKKTKALPTMLTGIALGTIGMAMLAISPSIWVFMSGIIIFSIGEMTAHPKFISYLGLIAPPDKKATYLGFGFLYGIAGSGIGGFLGAWLYVKFVDSPMITFIKTKLVEAGSSIQLASDAPIKEALAAADTINLAKDQIAVHANTSELWLVFSSIGVMCIIGLLLYQKFIGTREASDLDNN